MAVALEDAEGLKDEVWWVGSLSESISCHTCYVDVANSMDRV